MTEETTLESISKSPLPTALDEHSNQLGKLADLITTLGVRLEPVMFIASSLEQTNDPAQLQVAASPLAYQVKDSTRIVQELQSKLQDILNCLEI